MLLHPSGVQKWSAAEFLHPIFQKIQPHAKMPFSDASSPFRSAKMQRSGIFASYISKNSAACKNSAPFHSAAFLHSGKEF